MSTPNPTPDRRETWRLIIHGRVQGVGYRQWLKRQAPKHDINGWVRNRSDDTVEALLRGRKHDVHNLIAQTLNGPKNADVHEVTVTRSDVKPHSGFRVRENKTVETGLKTKVRRKLGR